MTTLYMFLTCIIPGPINQKNKIDMYLQHLIDKLKMLSDGVQTYDISMRQNFVTRAAVMWTVNDFPTLGMSKGEILYACGLFHYMDVHLVILCM